MNSHFSLYTGAASPSTFCWVICVSNFKLLNLHCDVEPVKLCDRLAHQQLSYCSLSYAQSYCYIITMCYLRVLDIAVLSYNHPCFNE